MELLQGYISSNKVEILHLSKTFLNLYILCDDSNLQLLGFDLIELVTHLTQKEGEFAFNFRISHLINIHYLNECITFEIKLGDKICKFLSLHMSPNQSEDGFKNFCNNFELTLDVVSAINPFFIPKPFNCCHW